RLVRDRIPPRLRAFRQRFEHHLILKVADEGIAEARAYLARTFPSATGAMFECTEQEAARAFLLRFVVAGAAVRYRAVHRREVADIVALDVALPRNTREWFEELPPAIADACLHKLYY